MKTASVSRLANSSAKVGLALMLVAAFCLMKPIGSSGQQARFCVQVSSETSEEAAQSKVAELKAKGQDAYWVKTEVPGAGVRYRVRVGQFPTEVAAKSHCNRLKQREVVTECFADRWIAPASASTQAGGAKPTASKPPASTDGNPAQGNARSTVPPAVTAPSAAADQERKIKVGADAPAPTSTPAQNQVPSPAPSAQASPNSSPTPRSDGKIRLMIMKPEVKSGGLTSTAFADRLIAALKNDPGFVTGYQENAVDHDRAKQLAAAQNFDFILFSSISSVEDKSLGSVVGKLGRKELRFKVAAEYTLEAIRDANPLLTDKADSIDRNVEVAVGAIVDKVVRDVVAKAKQVIASLPAAPSTVGPETPTPPKPSPAPTPVNPGSGSSQRLVVQTTHSTMVTDFAYSPDARLLATLGSDGIVKLWNTETRIEINTFSGYRTVGIAFSPDGKTIAALGKDNVIRLFNTASGQLQRRLAEINRSKVNHEKDSADLFNLPVSIAFGPEGRFIVSGSENGVRVWDVASGKHVRTLLKDKVVPLVAISPDGNHIAAAVDENEIKILSTTSGKEDEAFHSKVGKVTALVFSQNGQSLMIGSRYGTIRVFDISKGEETVEPPIYNDCDKPFASLGKIGVLRKVPGVKTTVKTVGDTCELVKDIGDLMKGRFTLYYETSIRSLALNPNGNLLAWSTGDNTVHATDLRTKKEVYNIPSESKAAPKGLLGAITQGKGSDEQKQPGATTTQQASGGNAKAQLIIAEFFQQLAPVKFSTDGKTLNSVREYKTIGRWNAETGVQVYSLALAKRDLSGGFPFPMPWGAVPNFGMNGDTMVTGSLSKGIKLWDLKYGNTPRQVSNSPSVGNKLPLSPDSKLLVQVVQDGKDMKKVTVKEVTSELEVKSFQVKCVAAEPAFSPDNKYIALRTYERGRFLADSAWLRIYEISTGQLIYSRKHVSHFEFSGNGKLLAMRLDKDESYRLPFTSRKDDIKIVNVGGAWDEVFKEKAEDSESGSFSSRVIFNTDSTLIASLDNTTIKVWEVATGKVIAHRDLEANLDLSNLIFQPNKKVLTYTTYRSLNHWDITTDKVRVSSLLTDYWGNLAYSADGKTLALGGAENRIRLFDVENEIEIGSLVVPSMEDWLVITPEGRLDTSRLEQVEEVHWILQEEPFSSQPLELFMREYYEPRLLARLVGGDTFSRIGDLARRNRTLPEVAIINATPGPADTVAVTVEVKNTFSKTQFDPQGRQFQSEAHDLRLFRDGQLVGYVDGTLIGANGSSVSRTFTVKLPHQEGKTQFEFSAYAFNNDRVKCLTTTRAYLPSAPPPPMKGKVYLINVGVNASENERFNLRFAANDARQTQAVLAARFKASGRYSTVTEIPLISDFKTANGKTTLAENNATKAAFKAVIDRMSGRIAQLPPDLLNRIPNAARIERVTPDDLVLISFAGHGYADKDGIFYMVPADVGRDGSKGLSGVLARCISSTELSNWLRDVDAAEMIMIIDACHSAAAVETAEFKPGPMGSRGLGQLSYDKGMQILAATQKNDYALEVQKLEHGLLTFALMQDGIEGGAADYSPTDKKIMTTEWLRYGAQRVPKLYQAVRQGDMTMLKAGQPLRGAQIAGEITIPPNSKNADAQQPALFNFLWKRSDILLVNLGQ